VHGSEEGALTAAPARGEESGEALLILEARAGELDEDTES